ncbi:MAG: YdcF family protein [Candidatus Azobacteroides sp.]|nr:YdcF family protein [Candidatus Azobacteroides sp.]
MKKVIGMVLLFIIIGSIFVVWFANFRIDYAARDRVYDNVDTIPYRKVGLLLGTSKKLRRNTMNPYFKYRIDAAVELFNAGKVSYIVVSGDNSRVSYNEPKDMQESLMERGIPKDKIYLDYAGFRTLDSVVRMNKIFGQDSFTVIFQPFHNKRAIFLGKAKGLAIIGYNANDVVGEKGLKTNIREVFARVKVFLDLIFGKEPKFLGESIEIK